MFPTFALPRGRGDREERQIDGRDVARIIQRAMTIADLEGDFGGHSLRAGFVTSAAQKNIPEVDIMRDAPLTTILG